MAGLVFSLLGPLQILLDGRPLTDFVYAKARALLIYLAVEADRPHSRDELVGLLWPELGETAARNNLRQALADLRRVLGEEQARPERSRRFLFVTREAIQFNSAADYSADVAAFSRTMQACARHRHRHVDRCPVCLAHMAEALALYRGDFLAGFAVGGAAPLEDWITAKREIMHRQAADACEHLAHHHERNGRYAEARVAVEQLLALEPWREEAHYDLMRLYSLSGQRSAALAQYATCCKQLRRELGVEPTARTTALYERLRRGESAPLPQAAAPERPGGTLPALPTPLVGRQTELAQLGDLLADPARRLITLSGPGGIGKTSLAVAAAAQHAEAFLDGAVFVDLAGVTQARSLPDVILAALGAPLTGRQSPGQVLRAYLRDLEMLVVLDNYEQLLPDVETLTDLLRYAPGVTWLVTSRERLAMHSEHLVEVMGLNYPQALQTPQTPQTLASHRAVPEQEPTEYAAVQLFLQRVQQTQPHFAPTAQAMAAIVRICRLTEGMPLALELAAVSTRVQSCTAIAAALESGQAHLAAHLRDLPQRHLSIHAAFEHSWRLLGAKEQRVLRALATFRGGFSAEAAQAVAEATPRILSSLIDKSLVYCQGEAGAAARYGMHELLRQYAEEKLAGAGEQAAAQYSHLLFFTGLAEEAEPKLRTDEQRHWLERLEREHDNLRAALEAALTHGWYEMAARLGGALGRFWFIRAHVHEALGFLEAVCSSPPFTTETPPFRAAAKACNSAGWMVFLQGNYAQAAEKFARGLSLAEHFGDQAATADALRGLALQALNQQDRMRAQELAQQSLAVASSAGEAWRAGAALNVLGDLARAGGAYGAAADLFAESRLQLEKAGDSNLLLIVQCNAAWVAHALGQDGHALALHQQVLRLAYSMGAVRAATHALAGVAGIRVHSLRDEGVTEAVRLLGAAEAIRTRANILLELTDRADNDACLALARSRLGEGAYLSAWAEGQALTLAEAVDCALLD